MKNHCPKDKIPLKQDISFNYNNIGGYTLYCPKCNFEKHIPIKKG